MYIHRKLCVLPAFCALLIAFSLWQHFCYYLPTHAHAHRQTAFVVIISLVIVKVTAKYLAVTTNMPILYAVAWHTHICARLLICRSGRQSLRIIWLRLFVVAGSAQALCLSIFTICLCRSLHTKVWVFVMFKFLSAENLHNFQMKSSELVCNGWRIVSCERR